MHNTPIEDPGPASSGDDFQAFLQQMNDGPLPRTEALAQESYSDDEWILSCPRCGEESLHHTEVTVYSRGEDENTTVRTVVDIDGRVAVEATPSDANGNPSRRRHGLAIRFSCENCDGHDRVEPIELTVAQHKGLTLVGWRRRSKRRALRA